MLDVMGPAAESVPKKNQAGCRQARGDEASVDEGSGVSDVEYGICQPLKRAESP